MKRVYGLIPALALVLMSCNNAFVLSKDNIVSLSEIQEREIERPVIVNLMTLEEYLLKGTYEDENGAIVPFDSDGNGKIESIELDAVTSLLIPENTINSLEGIEKFKNLTDFDASGNPLRHIKLGVGQTLKKLSILSLNNCSLETADLTYLSNLKRFYAEQNPNLTCVKTTSVQRSRAKNTHTRWLLPVSANLNCK